MGCGASSVASPGAVDPPADRFERAVSGLGQLPSFPSSSSGGVQRSQHSVGGSVLPDVNQLSFSQHPERIRKWASRGSVQSKYKFKETLGTGSFGVVKLGVSKETGKKFAIKRVSIEALGGKNTAEDQKALWNEVGLLLSVDHVNVASMYEFFVDAKEGVLYLVLELLKGGELLDAVCVNGSYSEADAKHIMRQLFSAVAYLHRKNICHRDLKLDNLLLPSEDDRTTIKLIDFGLSLRTTEEDLSTLCGTPVYVAPELAQAVLTARRRRKQGLAPLTYTKAVDMWACGVIMYLLLSGDVPFEGEDEMAMFRAVCSDPLKFHGADWRNVSKDAKEAIKFMLTRDPSARPTAEQVLQHPYFTEHDDSTATAKLKNTASNLRALLARKRLKKATHAVAAISRMSTLRKASLSARSEANSKAEAEDEHDAAVQEVLNAASAAAAT